MNIEERKKWIEERKDRIIAINYKQGKEMFEKLHKNDSELFPDLDSFYKDVWQPEKYEDKFNLEDELSNCEKKVCGVDLTPYIESIIHNDFETMIFLYIKNNKAIDEQRFVGKSYNVLLTEEDYEKICNKAKELNTDIYCVHNHPLTIAAIPSGKEEKYGDYNEALKLEKVCDKYNVKLLDWGVATECDYYSHNQKQ